MREAVARETGVGLDERKIIGGAVAVQGDDPWQVALILARYPDPRRSVFCGGSLIDPASTPERDAIWVLTAAHCVDGASPETLDVLAGTIDLDRGGQRIDVREIIIHRDYVRATSGDDIALLRLAEPVTSPASIALTNATLASLEAAGVRVRVTGWGRTSPTGTTTRVLRTLDTPVVSNGRCNDPVSYNNRITPGMLCAGRAEGGEDSCQGDSGGPLSSAHGQSRVLVGVVSWGEGCARRAKYGVYTRVSSYVNWVNACVSGGAACTRR
jgi:secreted trypsin-like serine protease